MTRTLNLSYLNFIHSPGVLTFRLLLLLIPLTAQPILDLSSSHHHAQYLGRPIY